MTHLHIPIAISGALLIFIFFNRRKLFTDNSLFKICIAVFFVVYFVLLVSTYGYDWLLDQRLQAFDLDGNGFFTPDEVNPDQQAAIQKVTGDTARNLVDITGLVVSGLVAGVVYLVGWMRGK